MTMTEAAKTRDGVRWKRANLSGLSKDTKRLYESYRSEYNKAQESAKALRMALNREWVGHYPDGKEGRQCTFHVINGVVNYAWVDKEGGTQEGEALFPKRGRQSP
jgi:hypothetical protein